MSSQIANRSQEQQAVVQGLVDRFQIDAEKILFLKPRKPLEPWLNFEALTAIARQSGRFRGLSEHYSTYIEALKQLVHSATVIDSDGYEYTRSGAARLGETLFENEEPDEHSLAAARALRLAFDSAGFDPVKSTTIVPLGDLKLASSRAQDQARIEALARSKDLGTIHMLAAQKLLIRPSEEDASKNDMTRYRAWLAQNFNGVESSEGLLASERAIAINLLRALPEPGC